MATDEDSIPPITWMSRIRTFLQPKRNAMNNDEWTTFEEKLTPEQRTAVEQARSHFFDTALTSYMVAFLQMLQGQEEHLTGLRQQTANALGNQQMIAEHLARQDAKSDQVVGKVEAMGSGLSALIDQFRETGEQLSEWRAGMDDWRVGMDAWREKVEMTLASFRESRDRSMQQHQETLEHRETLQTQNEAFDRQMGELLDLVHRLGVDVAALKDREQGGGG